MFRAAVAVVMLTLAPAAFAGVTSPQSGWYSGNPLLGTNALRDLSCAGSTCYASGGFGTLLKSGDGGGAWSGIVTGLTQDLPRVRLVAGDPARVVVGGRCVLRRSDDGGAHFRTLPFAGGTTCTAELAAFAFPTPEAGYVVTDDGGFRATRDGGTTWASRTEVPGFTPTDLACPGADECFTVAADGDVRRTTDGGASWAEVAHVDGGLGSIAFAGAGVGYAVGGAAVLRTADGGASWQPSPAPEELTGSSCDPADPNVCLFATGAAGRVLRTTDGGQTFGQASVPEPVAAVAFSSSSRAVAVGAEGRAAVSDDGGQTWTAVGPRIAGRLRVLRAVSSSVALAGGDGGLLARTDDSGQSWSAMASAGPAAIRDVASPDGTTVYALDARGGLARSSDRGATFQALGTAPARAATIVAVGARGLLAVAPRSLSLSADAGESFQPLAVRLSRRDSLTGADRASGAVVAYGPRTLLQSTDAGKSWVALRLPAIAGDRLRRVDFLTPRYGYALTIGRRVFKTTNAGARWQELLSTGGAGTDMAFSDPAHGYLTAPAFAYRYDGAVLRTSDGGKTWRPQIVAPGFLQAVASTGSTGYALAGEAALYATRTGGDAGSPSRLTLNAVRTGRTVIVSGRLAAADGDEQIVVSARSRGRWISRVVPIGRAGAWRSRWTAARTIAFVAQVLGDSGHSGAGTRAVVMGPAR